MNDFLPSQDLLAAIRQFEGLRLRLYTDAAVFRSKELKGN